MKTSFVNHLVAQGFREEVARDLVNDFHLKYQFSEYIFSDCYKFLIDVCNEKLEKHLNREFNFQADVIELCIEFGLREIRASVLVGSGLIKGPSTLKAYVTMGFLKTSYPGELNCPIRKKT